jgi:hypothetical protein
MSLFTRTQAALSVPARLFFAAEIVLKLAARKFTPVRKNAAPHGQG